MPRMISLNRAVQSQQAFIATAWRIPWIVSV